MNKEEALSILEDLAFTTDGNHLSEKERVAIKMIWQSCVDSVDD